MSRRTERLLNFVLTVVCAGACWLNPTDIKSPYNVAKDDAVQALRSSKQLMEAASELLSSNATFIAQQCQACQSLIELTDGQMTNSGDAEDADDGSDDGDAIGLRRTYETSVFENTGQSIGESSPSPQIDLGKQQIKNAQELSSALDSKLEDLEQQLNSWLGL